MKAATVDGVEQPLQDVERRLAPRTNAERESDSSLRARVLRRNTGGTS